MSDPIGLIILAIIALLILSAFFSGSETALTAASRPRMHQLELGGNMRARVVLCGGISAYNATEPQPGPVNLMNLVIMRARMEGFIVIDYMDRSHIAVPELLGWINSGEILHQEDVQEGFENIPDTLNRLFTGRNLGKQLLKIADPS